MDKLTIVLDGQGMISVPEAKATLAFELIQHFTPEWRRMAKEAQEKGEEVSSLDYVDALFRNLAIDHTIIDGRLVFLNILDTKVFPEFLKDQEEHTEPAHAAEETPTEETLAPVMPPMEAVEENVADLTSVPTAAPVQEEVLGSEKQEKLPGEESDAIEETPFNLEESEEVGVSAAPWD